MCGINDDLVRDEIVELFKDKLEYAVVKRLDTAFAAKEAPWTWEEVTYDDLKSIMKDEYGLKIAEVSEVLLQFGPGRFKKTGDMTVAKFTHQWQEQLPECMTPSGEAENAKFADLMKRALFYYCLDDHYLQKELCELEEADSTFKKYFDQACVSAEEKIFPGDWHKWSKAGSYRRGQREQVGCLWEAWWFKQQVWWLKQVWWQ